MFIKETNWQKDYMDERIKLQKGMLYYKEFLDTYPEVTHVLSNGQDVLFEYLLHDSDFELVYDSSDSKDKCRVFRKKDARASSGTTSDCD